MKKILNVSKLEKYYGKGQNITKALDGVSFSIDEGEFVGIMGPSGSGKTTLLNCISTIDRPTAGSIKIEEVELSSLKRDNLQKFRRESLGFIFQDFNLLDTLTGYENISLPLSILNTKSSEIDYRVKQTARLLEIENVIDKFPYQLSGGEQQRVAAARALITKPSIVLADEPTGALDSKASRLLLERLEELNKTMATTIMMVTHDAFTASYAKRILFIKDGKIFNELIKGSKSRKEFFEDILAVMTLLGGDVENVF
ncbi:MAG TPA: ABC transporter ATP-binding protein [Erysipelotrichaceae bacterium]|nr:ABC transporter ATP-binding protein [Erysipelotrichaceae bacterium]